MLKRAAVMLLLVSAAAAGELGVPAGKHGEFPAYIPDGVTKEKPCPLVVACHGHGDTAPNFLSGFRPVADAAGFAILVPEGVEKAEGGFGWNAFPDRATTIESAIKALLKDHPEVDAGRIVWLGHSAGCWVCCADGAPRTELCKGIVLSAPPTAALSVPPKGPKPRVTLFLGTEDFNFKLFAGHRDALKAAKVAFSVNQVKGLGHAVPDKDYLVAAIRWVLESEGADEENVLPKEPPGERKCRHLLLGFKGAQGADKATRSVDAARKEAQRMLDLLKKEKPEKRSERAKKASEDAASREAGGLLTAERRDAFGPLLRWACWTVPAGEVRLVRTPAGFHLVWAD